LQWQAELEQYDNIIARAWEIEDRWRQEELEDNDIIPSGDGDSDSNSGSELSILASSLFNGMEGIEIGGGIGIGGSDEVPDDIYSGISF
jgi:hypothetical protein